MARRPSTSFVTVTIAIAWMLVTATPATAACHIAGFVEPEVNASPSTGVVSLIVELQGRVGSCAGSVDVATVDGTAVAGTDYEAVTRTLTFEENDDRVETVDVTILADAAAGSTFTVELSNPTGDISGTSGPATVTIAGADDPAVGGEDDGDSDEAIAEEEAATADEGSNRGILLAVIAALVIGGGAFAVLRGRG